MENTELKQEVPAATPAPEKAKQVQPPKPKKKRKWLKRLIIVAVAALVVALVLRSCSQAGTSLISSTYLPSTAAKQELVVSVSGTGAIQPIHSYKVTTLIKGEVLEAPFEEGQTVHKDDLLFRIDSKDVESNISQLERSVQSAERSVQSAELSLQSAQLAYNDLLKTQSDNQKDRDIKANATGVVTKVYVDPGDKVSAGTPIADILDRDNLKLEVPFHSADAAAFTVGQAATVTVDGTLNTIYGSIDSIAATDEVGPGGTLVRKVTVKVVNPGALDTTSSGTATVGSASSAQSANFQYAESKQLVAKVSSEIETLNLTESGRVTEDQIVGQFKDTDLDTQIENARIAVQSSKLQVENARLQVENTKSQLQNARDTLEDYSITSTIDGTVIEKNYDVGDTLDTTSTAATGITYPAVIYDLSALTFDIGIDELDINKIHVGQDVEITSDALDGKTFTGKVDKVNINGATAGGVTTYPVTVLIDGSPAELKPGMNVSAKIVVEDAGTVLCIPVDAVQRGNTVLVAGPGALGEDGKLADPTKLEEREVTLGRNDSEYIEVLSGLEEGDVVYVQRQGSNAMAMMMGG